tara:strand:+ start:6386 stop:6877 length:492 start_codon:yes stop_codon:yes gene_type:complete
MNIFRFKQDNSAELDKATLRNKILFVSPKEAYGMQPNAVGFMWRSRLFGFLKPKRTHIVTVRLGDATPLYPLEKKYASPSPVDEYDLRDYENEFFLETQLNVEKSKKSNERTLLDKLLIALIGFAVVIFLIIAIGKNFTSIKDGFSGKGNITNLFSQAPIEKE